MNDGRKVKKEYGQKEEELREEERTQLMNVKMDEPSKTV